MSPLPKDNNAEGLKSLLWGPRTKWFAIIVGSVIVAGLGYCAIAGDGEPEADPVEEVAFVGSF